jgi:hypothetical protein
MTPAALQNIRAARELLAEINRWLPQTAAAVVDRIDDLSDLTERLTGEPAAYLDGDELELLLTAAGFTLMLDRRQRLLDFLADAGAACPELN